MIEFLTASFYDLLRMVNAIDPLYIYLTLFIIAFIENIIPPIPGDTFTIIGGYLAATGKLHLFATFLIIMSGTMLSIMLVYYVGYRGGHEYFARKDFRFFSVADLARVDRWFARHGAGTLLVSRFVVGGRVAIALASGISKYPPALMFTYSLISSMLFHGILIFLAYAADAYVDNLVDGFNSYSKIVLAILAAALILWLVVVVRRSLYAKRKA